MRLFAAQTDPLFGNLLDVAEELMEQAKRTRVVRLEESVDEEQVALMPREGARQDDIPEVRGWMGR